MNQSDNAAPPGKTPKVGNEFVVVSWGESIISWNSTSSLTTKQASSIEYITLNRESLLSAVLKQIALADEK